MQSLSKFNKRFRFLLLAFMHGLFLQKDKLQKNATEMYSTNSLEPYKIKFIKYTTSLAKNEYIDKLNDIVNKYNNTYHSTTNMKPVNVKSNTYIDSSKEINNEDPKFKIGDFVRTRLQFNLVNWKTVFN